MAATDRPDDRALYRAQLAVLLERMPQVAARAMAELRPAERHLVERERALRWLLAPPLAVVRQAAGGEVRYLGRDDGVYRQVVSAYGVPGPLERWASWEQWREENPDERRD